MNRRGCGCVFGQTGAHSDHRKFPAARHLKHVKIAVAVSGIKRLNRHRDQEIALSSVANTLASCRMADALDLMQRVRHVIGESGLFESPLAIRLARRGRRETKKSQESPAISIILLFNSRSLELNGYGQNRGSIRRSCYDGHRSMGTRDPVNFFPFTFLIKGNCSQDGCQDHPWAMNPGQRLVQADGPTGFGSRNFGRADGIVSAHEIQVPRHRAESKMRIAIGRTGALAAGAGP